MVKTLATKASLATRAFAAPPALLTAIAPPERTVTALIYRSMTIQRTFANVVPEDAFVF